jgi:hypothetical protein
LIRGWLVARRLVLDDAMRIGRARCQALTRVDFDERH